MKPGATRVAVVGMGAMGTLLAQGMAAAGHAVTAIDRPPRAAQIRAQGLVVVRLDGSEARSAPSAVSSDFADAGPQDVVVLATKAQQIADVAPRLAPLLGPDTMVVTLQNGIPWWYFQRASLAVGVDRLQSLDPLGTIARAIDARRLVGCVSYPAAAMDEAGRARHIEGVNFPIGELDGVELPRTRLLAQLLADAGFKSRILDDIRSELWLKAWGALSINPISALTRATMEDICTDPGTRQLVATMMTEAQAVAVRLGVNFRHTIEKRIEGARAVGRHKTSMLQDLERCEPLELDALLGAVIELGRIVGCPTPALEAVFACTSLLDRQARGLLPAGLAA